MSTEMVVHEPKKNEITLAAERISEGLIAFETRKTDLTKLKEDVEGLKITSLDDRESINQVSTARKKLKSARVEIEKEAKSMRDPLTKINKNISAKEKELIDIIEPTEKALKTQEDWVKEEEEKIAQEAERKEQERIQIRIDRLAAYGFAIDIVILKGIDDEQFEKTCESARVEWQKEQDAKAEEDRLAKEKQVQVDKDLAELKALRDKQAEADRILQERQDELDRQAQAIKKQQEQAEEKEFQRIQAEQDAEIKRRCGQLTAGGLVFDFSDNHYKGFGCFVPTLDIQYHSAEQWDKLMAEITPAIERAKKESADKAEAKRIQDIDDARQQAIIDEQARQKKIKEKQDEDARLAEIARQEQLAKDGDKAIWADFITRLNAVSVPTVRSGQYRKIAVMAREKLEEIQKLKP